MRGRQTDRQTDRQINRQINNQLTDSQTSIQTIRTKISNTEDRQQRRRYAYAGTDPESSGGKF